MPDNSNLAQPNKLTFFPDLKELVSVQPEATVSRTVLKSAGGRVVVFSFDEGQMLTEHTAAMPVFVQVISGSVRITAEGESVELRAGGLVYFPTRLPHEVLALEPTIMSLTMVDGHTDRPA